MHVTWRVMAGKPVLPVPDAREGRGRRKCELTDAAVKCTAVLAPLLSALRKKDRGSRRMVRHGSTGYQKGSEGVLTRRVR
jgi:hypothetical protein